MPAWRCVTLGVGDLDAALDLWETRFGFRRREDWLNRQALADRWSLEASRVANQALLGAPGTEHGWVRLVQFHDPDPVIRERARPWDRCAKNLDIRVDNLPARLPILEAAGCHFLNDDYSEVTAPNGTRFREMHLHAHDGINIVLLEVLDDPLPFSEQGFTGVSTLVTPVADLVAEKDFYTHRFGLDTHFHHTLEGEEVTRMIGLPDGARLDLCVLGEPGVRTGQMELIRYRGVHGQDLFPRARPPARGILDVDFSRRAPGFVCSPAGLRIAADAPAADTDPHAPSPP